jgi:nitronate monooxygenase
VVANVATERWLSGNRRGPAAVRLLNRLSSPVMSRLPAAVINRAAAAQRPGLPFYGPAAPLAGRPANLLDTGALYAGETVARINELRSAGELTREFAGA